MHRLSISSLVHLRAWAFAHCLFLLMTCLVCACVSRTVAALCGMFQPPRSTSAESQSALQTFRVFGSLSGVDGWYSRRSCTALIPVRVFFIRRGNGQHCHYGSRGLLKGLPLEEPTAAAGESHAQSDWVVVERVRDFWIVRYKPRHSQASEGRQIPHGNGDTGTGHKHAG